MFSNLGSFFSEKFTFRVNPEATANQVGIYLSIMLTDQGADTHPSTLPFCCRQWHIVFKCLSSLQKLTLFIKPGPLIGGLPSLSDEIRCNSTVTRMSVYSFQNENDGPQQNATLAARCTQGVLLPAAVGAPPRCACKFLVPHFSSFGVSKQIMRAREIFPEYASFHYDSLKRILSGCRRFNYCSTCSSSSSNTCTCTCTSSSSNSSTFYSSSSNKSSIHHQRSF